MILFLTSLILLILGYFTYAKFIEKIWGADENFVTPAIKYNDGVDFVQLPLWRIFLIQFLNIAGLGPVFGAILGAIYGPVALLWIVFGCIFAGGVHDYLTGMISVRHDGKSIVHITEELFGKYFKVIFLIFFVGLLFLLGTVFAVNPAKMLSNITHIPLFLCIAGIFGYYFLATLLPIDKIIGKFYPIFAALLVLMTIALLIALILTGKPFYPNLTFNNLHPQNTPIFPILFITIACGAISGFHATQSPIMSRCLPNEKYGRLIFYGAMVTEGIIALIWATLSISFYQETGGLLNAVNNLGQGGVVSDISINLLGKIGGTLTVLSIIILSITSGDTAFRSIRITIADCANINQKHIINRLTLSAIILGLGIFLSKFDLTTLWQYFGWANQTLSTLVLWTLSYYLALKEKNYWITFIPALFMNSVVLSYILQAKIGFSLNSVYANSIAIILTIILGAIFIFTKKSKNY